MKKVISKILALSLVASMLSTTVFASETMEIPSDYGEEIQLSLSNVISVENDEYVINSFGEVVPTYICESGVSATLLSEVDAFVVYAVVYEDGEFVLVSTDDYVAEGSIGYFDFEAMEFLTVDLNELTGDEYIEESTYYSGSSYTFTNPGVYYVATVDMYVGDSTNIVIAIADENGDFPVSNVVAEEVVTEEVVTEEVVTEETGKVAEPTDATILVDGEEVSFDAYEIEDNNYFKLRDVAAILSGTEATFEITWNEDAQAIDMISGEEYTVVGGELETGDGTVKTAETSTATIYLDGEEVSLTAYTINDNNYFKLRDLGEALGFNVSWDGDANSIVVASNEAYTAD